MNSIPGVVLSLFIATSDGGRIAYDDQGAGPLIICLPSMGDLRQEYRFLTPFLVASGFRVVTMDVRGMGESSPGGSDLTVAGVGADLAVLIASLNSGPAVVLGNSMAGGAAVWLAAEHPELVSKLVLIDPFVRGDQNFWMQTLYSLLFGGPWGPSAWASFYQGLYTTQKPDDFKSYLTRLESNLREPGRMNSLLTMLKASKAASGDRLSQVRTPVLVLMGEKDPDFAHPEEEAAWVAGQLGGRYEMIPQAGHYPHAEFPEAVAPLVVEFLRS